jgi:hypothetical protein
MIHFTSTYKTSYLPHDGFLLGLFFDPEDKDDMFLRTFNGLHSVISQKIWLFGYKIVWNKLTNPI